MLADQLDVQQLLSPLLNLMIWFVGSSNWQVLLIKILKSRNYTIHKAYLIYIDGKLVYFQDHQPEIDGYITIDQDTANEIAENFITNKIEENVDNIIVEKVINDILSK